MDVLNGVADDNGELYFICCIDDENEIDNEDGWFKANPSLYPEMDTYSSMMRQMRIEYKNYKRNPTEHTSFPAKRMNCPPMVIEGEVAKWNLILDTNQDIDEDLLFGMPCVGGIDYMRTTDFLSAGLLYRVQGKDYWIQRTWVCRHSNDLSLIKAPLDAWALRGDVEFVDAEEIPPELPAVWLKNEAAKRNSRILRIGIDDYRYQLLSNALLDVMNFSAEKGWDNVTKIRPRDEMRYIPLITSGFTNRKFCWGDVAVMRWAAQNSKIVTSPQGNMTYGKIEPKSRKTDPFKAFVAAEVVSGELDQYEFRREMPEVEVFEVYAV